MFGWRLQDCCFALVGEAVPCSLVSRCQTKPSITRKARASNCRLVALVELDVTDGCIKVMCGGRVKEVDVTIIMSSTIHHFIRSVVTGKLLFKLMCLPGGAAGVHGVCLANGDVTLLGSVRQEVAVGSVGDFLVGYSERS